MPKRPALGRGLASLLPETPSHPNLHTKPSNLHPNRSIEPLEVRIESIVASRVQPRSSFNPEALAELASSIKDKGILQPLLVRQLADGYELIAGERRLRASRMAGLQAVPVVLRDVGDREALELALVENVQREDLNAIELAKSYRQLHDEFGYTQEQIAARVGKDRSTITNHLRLLKLSESTKCSLANGEITMGHARALLSLEENSSQEIALAAIINDQLSVRQTERLVKRLKNSQPAQKDHTDRNPDIDHLVERLTRALQTRVRLAPNRKGGGEIRIEYFNSEELSRILELIPEA